MRRAYWWFVAWIAILLSGCLGPKLVVVKQPLVTYVEAPAPKLDGAYRATALLMLAYGPSAARMESCGSGVLVAPNRILTAAHVVAHGTDEDRTIEIIFGDGKVFAGKVARMDRALDLALVDFGGHVMVEPASVAASEPALLSAVWNFGAPECRPGFVSEGRWMGIDDDHTRIVSGGFVWPGMSGGPVVDASGAIVGINHGVYADDEHTIIQQMGYVTDYADVARFMNGGH